ncbi:MAG: hypothetical protein M3Q65_24875 [Chloroflexota bacterium]|nr:hypothetical protein [Chloroflexota bacterium]
MRQPHESEMLARERRQDWRRDAAVPFALAVRIAPSPRRLPAGVAGSQP